jgi:orotate phosphoribosyltransferase
MTSTTSTRTEPSAETRQILIDCRAILENDHFVYITGEHGSGWVDKDTIFVDLVRLQRLAELLAKLVADIRVDYLCGPATGGLIVSQWTAAVLKLPAVFAEHDASHTATDDLRGAFLLRRGYDRLVEGKRVLIVDDVVNSGHSIRQTAQAVRRAGGTVVAAAAFVHRGNTDAAGMNVPEFRYLLEYDIPEWPARECPLCKAAVPINTRYAHGQDFLDAQLTSNARQ